MERWRSNKTAGVSSSVGSIQESGGRRKWGAFGSLAFLGGIRKGGYLDQQQRGCVRGVCRRDLFLKKKGKTKREWRLAANTS